MRILVSVFFLLLCASLFSQFEDDFSDGDFTNNPEWIGETDRFSVENEELRLTAPGQQDESYLSTFSQAIDNASWEFYLRMTFQPSGSNLARIYLVSNQSDLKSPLEGYFVKIGDTPREISLYRQDGENTVEIIDGVDGRVAMNPVNVRVRVTRDDLGNWELESDTLGGTDYFTEGSAFDDTYFQSFYFGVRCIYTATRSDRFYYDDFVVTGDAYVDTEPPVIESVEVLSATELSVQFNEPLNQASAENTANYSVDNGVGNPVSAVLEGDPSLVTLTFGTAFPESQTSTLTVNGVEDIAGNPAVNETASFFFFTPTAPQEGDIVINEIMANPTPVIGLPDQKFIELYNASANAFNLEDWGIADRTTSGTIQAHVLAPGEYVILCSTGNVAEFEPFGDVVAVNSFPSPNITNDDLTLTDSDGSLIDYVYYTNQWYQDSESADGGYTLELINPFYECHASGNWRASVDVAGGTPGQQNSIFDDTPDTTPPSLTGVLVIDDTTIEIYFDEPMDSVSVVNATYTVSDGLEIVDFTFEFPLYDRVTLTLNQALEPGIVYTLVVDNVFDCWGNSIGDENEVNFISPIPVEANERDIVISEIMANPTPVVGLPDKKYIEIHNTTSVAFNMNGWTISDRTSTGTINNKLLLPGDYLILCSSSNVEVFSDFGNTVSVASFPAPNISGDDLILRDPDGKIIDFVFYTDKWYRDDSKSEGGYSLELINPDYDCSGADNWRASNANAGGTPGAQNSVYDLSTDDTPPRLLEVLVVNEDTIQAYFNEPLDTLSVFGADYIFSDGLQAASFSFNFPDYSSVIIGLSEPLDSGVVYTLEVQGIADCWGNMIETHNKAQFALPQQADQEDIIINEVLFAPRTGSREFVEIYNNSEKIIDLEDWYLANYSNDTISSHRVISERPFLLYPEDYVILTRDSANIRFEYPNSQGRTFIQMATLPSYNNNEGTVYLIDNLDRISDEFSYNTDMHFAMLRDVRGVSLERLDFNRPASDPGNWHSAAEKVGFATPGFENSQFFPTTMPDDAVTLDPEIFSPDNDGFDDLLNILYEFDKPGYVGNITIFDTHGRVVRQLMNNELLATKGVVTWDGINERNERVRIGSYIVFVEIFDTEGNTNSFKKVCVVASKLD